MKKLIISLSTTLVIFSSLYFLIEEDIIKLKSTRLRDLIRKNIETEYVEKTDILALGFQRFITITHQKLNFILEEAEINNLLQKGGDKKTASVLKDYVNSDPYCQRIRVVNQRLEIVFSTSDNDVIKSKLDGDLYGNIFQEPLSDRGSPIIDPITESIIFSRYTDEDKDRRFAVLFYYVQDALDSTFNQVESLNYKGFLITTDKIILINFPEIDISDNENLAGLVQLISENEAGVVRILLEGHDKTIYYKNLPDTSLNWTVGLTLDTEHLRISKIGTLILITQALVILSVLIFVFISLRRKKERRELPAGPKREAVGIGKEVPTPQTQGPGHFIEVETTAPGTVEPEPAREALSSTGPLEPGRDVVSLEEVVAFEEGIISLKDIEEVTEVEEIGEAEVAGEIEEAEEVEELSEGEEAPEAEEVPGLEAAEVAEEVEELPEGEEAPEAEELKVIGRTGEGVTPPSETTLKGDFDILEPIEDDLTGLVSGIQSTSNYLPELKKLVQAGYFDTQDESISPGSGIASNQKPEESGVISSDEEGAPPTIPDEVFKEKEKVYHDDELSYLIDRIGEKELDMEEKGRLGGIFTNFIHHLGISTGAILIKNREGTFSPIVSSGLSKDTVDKLIFKESEKILKSLLKQGKTLFIRENPFFNGHMRSKFRPVDSSKIKGIIFSPIFISEKLKGIVAVCLTMGEILDSEIVLKEIKKLKRIITRFK